MGDLSLIGALLRHRSGTGTSSAQTLATTYAQSQRPLINNVETIETVSETVPETVVNYTETVLLQN